jgi:DNA polymerase-3 subunit delta'
VSPGSDIAPDRPRSEAHPESPEVLTGDGADSEMPVRALFHDVVGQDAAIDQLRSSARRPVHAYLLLGPPGVGQRALVRGFAAALLCPNGGCGQCSTCRRSLAGIHPDLVEVDRSGPSVTVEDARRIVNLAQRRPLEARRQVIAVSDVHLALRAAPVLLKTLEEPAGDTVFILLADLVPHELVTIASRCVEIELHRVSPEALTPWLVAQGVEPAFAREMAVAAGGSADRAKLLVHDEGFAARRLLWRDVPTRLDGTGATAANLATELLASAEEAVEPLRALHQSEMQARADQAEATGERGVPGRKDIEDHHRREERRWRSDEIKAGLGVLAGAYRDRLVADVTSTHPSGPGRLAERVHELSAAVGYVEAVSVEMIRNPNESLMLEALLVRLSAVTG